MYTIDIPPEVQSLFIGPVKMKHYQKGMIFWQPYVPDIKWRRFFEIAPWPKNLREFKLIEDVVMPTGRTHHYGMEAYLPEHIDIRRVMSFHGFQIW